MAYTEDQIQAVLDAYASIGRTGVGSSSDQIDEEGLAYWAAEMEKNGWTPGEFQTVFDQAVQGTQEPQVDALTQQYLDDPRYATLNYTANTGYGGPSDEGSAWGTSDIVGYTANGSPVYKRDEDYRAYLDYGGDTYLEGNYDAQGQLTGVTQEERDGFFDALKAGAPAFALMLPAVLGMAGMFPGATGAGASGMMEAYLPVGETLGTGITATTGAGIVGGGIAGTGLTLSELAAATGLSESVLSSAITAGTLTELIDSVAGGLTPGSIDVLKDLGISDVGKLVDIPGAGGGSKQPAGSGINPLALLTGGLSILGAKDIYNKTAAMGPDMLSKYNSLGAQMQGQYGNISSGIRNDMGGLFDAARQQGLDAYGAASQIDLNNLRQQEFDIMQAMFADPRAAQAASAEARQIAQGRGGLQSFNQAYSADFTDPTTGQTYTVGANPADVAMYKAWANDDLNAYLQADKNALNRYSTLANLGNQASSTALGIQDTWNRPLMSGIDAFGRMGATGIQSYGTAQFKANDAYANMVAGLMGGVQNAASGSGGTQLNTALNKGVDALYSYGKDAVGNVWDSFTGLFS